jgi:drug/metabolite transporter (DMT)-like permease
MLFLHEEVSSIRWAGVFLVMLGAALISYSEHAKGEHKPADGQSSAALHSQ